MKLERWVSSAEPEDLSLWPSNHTSEWQLSIANYTLGYLVPPSGLHGHYTHVDRQHGDKTHIYIKIKVKDEKLKKHVCVARIGSCCKISSEKIVQTANPECWGTLGLNPWAGRVDLGFTLRPLWTSTFCRKIRVMTLPCCFCGILRFKWNHACRRTSQQ